MPNRVQFAEAIEPLVQFIEETPPAEILDRTLEKLRAGTPTQTMLTASALAVARSSDLPPGHHGGPLHPLAGLYAVSRLVERLEGEQRFVPVLQHVALSNKHIHHPAMGPYSLLEFAPIDAGGAEATKAAFLAAVNRGETNRADHLFLWLWQNVPPIEAFDLLLSVAIPKNALDDHYFIFPSFTWRALETMDQAYLPILMRPSVRYVTRFPTPRAMPEIDTLIEEHQLLIRVTRQETGEDETTTIGQVGEAIGRCDDYKEIPVLLAKALAGGLLPRRRRRGLVHRGCRSFPAFPDWESHGCSPAYQRQPAPLPASPGWSQPAEQTPHTAVLAYRSRGEVNAVPDGASPAARSSRGRSLAVPDAGRIAGGDYRKHLQPAADRLVDSNQSGKNAGGSGSQRYGEPGPAICEQWL